MKIQKTGDRIKRHRGTAADLRGFTRNKAQRDKVRDKGKEGWLGVDYVPGVVEG